MRNLLIIGSFLVGINTASAQVVSGGGPQGGGGTVGPLNGDVTGPSSNTSVGRILGRPLSTTPPAINQALCWNGSAWVPGSCTTSAVAGAAGSVGSLQFNAGGTPNVLGGYVVGGAFTTAGGIFDLGDGLVTGLKLASGAAAFNVGNLSGDLAGLLPSPSLAVGVASRNVGNLGNALTGTLPNPGLNGSAVFASLGTPGGDLGGTSYSAPRVVGIQGFPVANTPPTPQSAYVWNGSQFTPQVFSPGFNLTTGDVVCGPGSGTQPCRIQPGVVTNADLATASPVSLKGNAASSPASPTDIPIGGGLDVITGALEISPVLVNPQQVAITTSAGTQCFSYSATGQLTNLVTGNCSSGTILTADNGSTQLTADDGATLLTADGGGGPVGCTPGKYAFNAGCNTIFLSLAVPLLRM